MQLQALVATQLLAPGAKANTAAATSSWVDVREYEGDIIIVCSTGTVTAGTVTPTIQHATDGSGAGVATITPNEGAYTAITTSNDPLSQIRTVNANAVGGWIRILGTIATGPADMSSTLIGRPKYTA